jgi:hypothetical protein
MTDDQLDLLAAWYRNEYRKRTKAVKDGTAIIEWLAPGYRVTLTEVRSHAESIGITMNAQDTIDWLHHVENGLK